LNPHVIYTFYISVFKHILEKKQRFVHIITRLVLLKSEFYYRYEQKRTKSIVLF